MWEFVHKSVTDGAVVGLPYALTFLGVWVVFRLFDDFDLTVDGSFTLGGAVSARMIFEGWDPTLSIVVAAMLGSAAGLVTFLLMRALQLTLVLTSITVALGLYSISLWVMGQPNRSVVGSSTVFTKFNNLLGGGRFVSDQNAIILAGVITVVVYGLFMVFLRSEAGLAFRASGLNPTMARGVGVSPTRMLMLAIMVGNSLAAAGGALVAQQQGFADVSMGVGVILFGVTAVLLGEVVIGFSKSIVARLVSVLIGALLYRSLLAAAFRAGFPPQYLQGVTAVLILGSIAIGRLVTTARRGKPQLDATPDAAVAVEVPA
jgi:putative tryptophan/tyrosine transport system permease protein